MDRRMWIGEWKKSTSSNKISAVPGGTGTLYSFSFRRNLTTNLPIGASVKHDLTNK
jgi:hypothetical protein